MWRLFAVYSFNIVPIDNLFFYFFYSSYIQVYKISTWQETPLYQWLYIPGSRKIRIQDKMGMLDP